MGLGLPRSSVDPGMEAALAHYKACRLGGGSYFGVHFNAMAQLAEGYELLGRTLQFRRTDSSGHRCAFFFSRGGFGPQIWHQLQEGSKYILGKLASCQLEGGNDSASLCP